MMKAQKGFFAMAMVAAALFLIAGCSSNPMSSTQTVPAVDNSCPQAGDAVDNTCDSGGVIAGNPTDPTTDIPKYHQNDDDEEEFPVWEH